MKRIEFGEVRINDISKKHIQDVLDSNWPCSGPKVLQFEKEFAELFNYKHCKAVSSGTDAILNACLTLYDFGAKPGDEIIVPALSFIATSNAVRAAGFTPVFVDVRFEDLCIDVLQVEDNITSKTRAIIYVSTMGIPMDLSLRNICDKHNLMLICDNAEGHGCNYQGEHMGDIADISTYSFYAAHLLVAGEGGAVCTNRDDINDIINSTRTHGREQGNLYFNHVRFGLNSKMNDLEAALALGGVSEFWKNYNIRKSIYREIRGWLVGFEHLAWFTEERYNVSNCPHGFSITVKPQSGAVAKNLINVLDKANIHWKRNFGCIPTQHSSFAYLGYKLGNFPRSEWIGDNGIHIGIHRYLTTEEIYRITECLHGYFSTCSNKKAL